VPTLYLYTSLIFVFSLPDILSDTVNCLFDLCVSHCAELWTTPHCRSNTRHFSSWKVSLPGLLVEFTALNSLQSFYTVGLETAVICKNLCRMSRKGSLSQ